MLEIIISGLPPQTTRSLMPSHKIVIPLNRQQVAQHLTENDCLVIINSHVYDVTAFVENHPGGRYILDAAGKDATAVFYSTHPDHAYRHLEKPAFKSKYFIATVSLGEKNHYHFLNPLYKEIRESVSSYLHKQHNKKTRDDTLIVWLLFFLAVNILAIRNFCSYVTFLSSVLLGLSIGLTDMKITLALGQNMIPRSNTTPLCACIPVKRILAYQENSIYTIHSYYLYIYHSPTWLISLTLHASASEGM